MSEFRQTPIIYEIFYWPPTTPQNFHQNIRKEVCSLAKLQVISESVIRGRSRNPVTWDMNLFATKVHGYRKRIWMLDVVELVNLRVFILFQCFAVAQMLIA